MRASTKDINTYAHVIDLFAELASLPDDSPAKERLRTEIIESCLPLAENVANRYRGRGQPHDDLVQVARLGLIAAVDRFDLSKGADFLSFAVPTMMGEVRRHFRDRGWAVRVPRALQERHLALKKAMPSLTQTLYREPTTSELAHELEVEPHEIGQIIAVSASYRAASLDIVESDDGRPVGDTLGDYDAAIEGIDNHETLRAALQVLPERHRMIVLYRFFDELTQSEIAAKIGISQMHVSRLLMQSLKVLRTEIGDLAA
ncbi:SigB/SigF/SigG family RNA polymerase sigma factor [Rhodococcus globerulus]|uniref:SigB/SigF/SigG family RNA polymerase sigma factor n=1 Tax=Rhodococcus globerulus TaxID=33008 RepID=UPI0021651256|nr:SigB/SigF/SigG family RNA polymerase sigma factor [Rhodococcus globerulus]